MKRDWLQIVSNIAIIAGLAIVVYELNQSRDLAFGEMINGEYSMINDRYLAAMGDAPHHAFAKAAFDPSTITSQDAVVLDAYYNAVIYGWYKVIRMTETTGIERDWRGTVSNSARETFTTEPGRRWLRAWAEHASWALDERVSHLYGNAWSEIEEVALRK